MKTFITPEGTEYTIPDLSVVGATKGGFPVLRIDEGEFKGIQFSVSDTKMSDDGLDLQYHLDTEDAAHVDKIKPIVDNWLLILLYEQIERMKNEDKTAE